MRLRIAVLSSPGESFQTECFRLLSPSTPATDDLPHLLGGKLTIEGVGRGSRLLVSTSRPINEPIIRVTLQVGCDQNALRREYVLLLDPPLTSSLRVASASTLDRASPAVPTPMQTPAGIAQTGLITEDAEPAKRQGMATKSNRPRASSKAANPPASTASTNRGLTRALLDRPKTDHFSLQAASPGAHAPLAPRLMLSGGLAEISPGQTKLSEDALALLRAKQARIKAVPEDQDLTISVEAELVVLDKRLKELQATLDAAQAKIKVMETREPAATPPAPPSASPESAFDLSNWYILVGLGAGLAILVLLMVQRRHRLHEEETAWPPEPVEMKAAEPGETMLGPQAPHQPTSEFANPTPVFKATPGLSYYHVGDTTHHLSVSELAQVTEEARVFLTLGHPDKAILALRDHIDTHGDTAPAPWLMLLDLYRRTDNRGEYERCAAEFRHRYNAFLPPWEDPTAGQEGPGLETYPHLVKQICDLWQSPTCKVFLDELLYDNRGGNRIGFNLGAYQDIMLLRALLEARETEALSAAPLAPPASRPSAPALAPLADLELELDQDLLPLTSNRCALEADHPGILERLSLNWGTPHVVHFLESLLFADHTAKSSFGEAALSELMMLHDIAVELAGLQQQDHWDQEPGSGRKIAQQ